MSNLDGKVAIVTGGAHGIGRAYCHGLAKAGAAIVVNDLHEDAIGRVLAEVETLGGRAIGVPGDVSAEADVDRLAKTALESFGRIDCLINNAARFLTVPLERPSSIEEASVAEWDKVFAVNVRGVFLCCRAVAPAMRKQRYGKIVNISSTTALQGLARFGPYPASKAAVIGMTRGLARDLGEFNITVNCVAPGGTLSKDEIEQADLDRASAMLVQRPGQQIAGVTLRAIKRVQTPEDLVGAVIFLCSPESDVISGQTIVIDGGSYMQ